MGEPIRSALLALRKVLPWQNRRGLVTERGCVGGKGDKIVGFELGDNAGHRIIHVRICITQGARPDLPLGPVGSPRRQTGGARRVGSGRSSLGLLRERHPRRGDDERNEGRSLTQGSETLRQPPEILASRANARRIW
jgi:hypothetical protein